VCGQAPARPAGKPGRQTAIFRALRFGGPRRAWTVVAVAGPVAGSASFAATRPAGRFAGLGQDDEAIEERREESDRENPGREGTHSTRQKVGQQKLRRIVAGMDQISPITRARRNPGLPWAYPRPDTEQELRGESSGRRALLQGIVGGVLCRNGLAHRRPAENLCGPCPRAGGRRHESARADAAQRQASAIVAAQSAGNCRAGGRLQALLVAPAPHAVPATGRAGGDERSGRQRREENER